MKYERRKIADLLDCIIDNRGKTPPISDNGYCLLEINCIAEKRKYPNYTLIKKYVSEETYRSWFRSGHPQKGDILIPTVGTLDAISVMDRDDCCIAQNMIAFRVNSSICDNEYLYYVLCDPIVRKRLLNLDIGGVQPSIKVPHIKNLEINIPQLNVQKQISSILCAIDEKLQINNYLNDNLLQLAMLLFVHVFIDNPLCSERRPLYEFADYINGAAFKQDDYAASGLPIVKIAELKNGITDSTQFFAGDKGEKYLIHDKDILFSWSGNPDTSIDIFIWASGDAILNQHTFNVKSKEGFRWFVFLMLKYFKPQFAKIASNKQTTGLGHVTASDLKRLTFIYDRNEIEAFEAMVEPIMEKVFGNMLENRSLTSLRNTLLPRLMSGEIDISSVAL